MPAGEYGRVSFLAPPDHAAFGAIQRAIQPGRCNLSVVVAYSDLSGQQETRARFDVYYRSEAHYNWEVRQVFLEEIATGLLYAGSAPVA